LSTKIEPDSRGLVPAIHALLLLRQERGWPGQARPWRT